MSLVCVNMLLAKESENFHSQSKKKKKFRSAFQFEFRWVGQNWKQILRKKFGFLFLAKIVKPVNWYSVDECASWLQVGRKSCLDKWTLTSDNQHPRPWINMMLPRGGKTLLKWPDEYIYVHYIGWRKFDAAGTRVVMMLLMNLGHLLVHVRIHFQGTQVAPLFHCRNMLAHF